MKKTILVFCFISFIGIHKMEGTNKKIKEVTEINLKIWEVRR